METAFFLASGAGMEGRVRRSCAPCRLSLVTRQPGQLAKSRGDVYRSLVIPTVSLGVSSAVVSNYGHDSGQIEQRVAHSLAGHWATHEGLRYVHHTAIRCARRPSPLYGSIMAGICGSPRGVAPIQHHPAMRDTSTVAHGRRSDIIAPSFLGMRCPNSGPLFASS